MNKTDNFFLLSPQIFPPSLESTRKIPVSYTHLCAAAESLGYEPVRAAAEKEAARAELSELRSGPAGARILSGLEKARKLRLEHDLSLIHI